MMKTSTHNITNQRKENREICVYIPHWSRPLKSRTIFVKDINMDDTQHVFEQRFKHVKN